jgi:hypothetical protein
VAPFQKGNVKECSKQQQKESTGIVCYFWWHIWKERNKRIFENEECSFNVVVKQTREGITNFRTQEERVVGLAHALC